MGTKRDRRSRNTELGTGNRLHRVLVDRKINQAQLARAVGTTQAAISRIVTGKQALTAELALKIGHYTGVRAAWLLTGELPVRPDHTASESLVEAYQAGWNDAVSALQASRDWMVSESVHAARSAPSTEDLRRALQHRQEFVRLGMLPADGSKKSRKRPA